MVMNKSHGNMYGFVTHTWNAIKGKCPHNCSYCYMKRFPQKELRFDEKELKTDLGEGNFIFVGSSTDMFAEDVKEEWIIKTLEHCKKYLKNTYLFQSKNPKRFLNFKIDNFPNDFVLGITLETNRENDLGNAPSRRDRQDYFFDIDLRIRKMITIEPIMDFDVYLLVKEIAQIKPEFVFNSFSSNLNSF